MICFTVCVDFADVLELTLPYNRHHFNEQVIVTNRRDRETVRVGIRNGCIIHRTDVFYENGADFNKWAALEEALRVYRNGDICLLDCDILVPKGAEVRSIENCLQTPYRRMNPDYTVLPEDQWKRYPLHHVVNQFPGYMQVFNCNDPVLSDPWFQQNWRHAGGADSFFQARWKPENKIRPEYEVLHLGQSHQHWCGRIDMPTQEAQERKKKLRYYFAKRKATDSYEHEKF